MQVVLCEFGGVDITQIANVFHVDTNRGAVDASVSSFRLGSIGESYSRKTIGRRTVSFRFALVDHNHDERMRALERISQWVSSEEEKTLRILPERMGYLNAVCDTVIDPSYHNRVETIQLDFVACDPRFYANHTHESICTAPVFVDSNHAPFMRIVQQVSSPLVNPFWMLWGKLIAIDGTVPAGTLEMVPEHGTCTVNGNDFITNVTLDSRLDQFVLRKGMNTITCGNGAGGQLFVRERWL